MTKIILLNGASSSGKTTIGKLLQENLSDPEWLFLSLDDFLAKLPKHAFSSEVKFSENILKAIPAFHKSIAAIATSGVPLILDHVFQEHGWFDDFASSIAGISVLAVKVSCPFDVLKSREKSRGDRQIGLAEMQFAKVHQGVGYDIEVDTSRMNPTECRDLILQKLKIS